MIATLLLALAASPPSQDTSRLTLGRAVALSLAQYPSVAAARAARERAGAELGEVRGARLPRLVLEGSATRFQEPMLVYPLHGFPSAAAPAAAAVTFDRMLLQGSAFVSWTLWDFGQRGARIRAARALTGAADAALGGAELSLVTRTATGYLRVLTARQTLAAQDQRLAALAYESERTRRLFAEGKAARIEQLRADAELARSRADRIATAAQLDVSEHDLAQLIGTPFEGVRGAALAGAALRDTLLADTARAVLVARALVTSPEVLEVRRRAGAAEAAAGAARATRLPELRLSSGVIDRGKSDGALRAEWQAGLTASYALYTGGSRASQIRRAEADARVAAEQLRLAELNVALQVDRSLAALREAHARVAALGSAAEQSAEVARIERLSLDVGSGTQTDYLEAEAILLRARASLIEARHAEIAARIELARVTGELSPGWLALNLE